MKIRQWLGYNEDASQYLLRPGELRVLNNLQSRRPGMLIARPGIKKIYGEYDDETIFGLYRRSTILGTPSDFLWLQKILVEKVLSADEIGQSVFPLEHRWQVKRIKDDQARVIDELEIAPNGTSINNFSLAEDRHGRIFIFYGHGVEPRLYRPDLLSTLAIDMGMPAPLSMPKITPSGEGFFIEQVDVDLGGGGYNSPPNLTVTEGDPIRPAKLKALVQRGNVVGVDIIDGGAGYKTPPEIKADLSDVGSGFRAIGIRSGSAATISGFDDTSAGSITGTGCGSNETYGNKDGTENQQIAYTAPLSETDHTLSAWMYKWAHTGTITPNVGYPIPLERVDGLLVGMQVRLYIYNFNGTAITSFTGTAYPLKTITGIDTVNKTVTLDSFFANQADESATYGVYLYSFVVQSDSSHRVGLSLEDVNGISVGDIVKFTPDINCIPVAGNTMPTATTNLYTANYTSFNAAEAKVLSVDANTKQITVDKTIHVGGSFTSNRTTKPAASSTDAFHDPVSNKVLVATTNQGSGYAAAIYESSSRRYFANIPLTTASSVKGQDAHATLVFSPLPLGYAVNTSGESSKGVSDTGLNKHFNIIGGEGGRWTRQTTLTEYLYGEYWSGSDFDRPGSSENASYGGLQASGSSFVHGFSGTTGGRKTDVYWPDYSKLSVWFNTGVRSSSLSQWTRADVTVQQDSGGARYIEFDLKPHKQAKKVTSTERASIVTEYEDQVELPEATPPKVRINLVDCPDTWIVEGDQCIPTANKETGRHGQGNRLPWYSPSSGVPRPVVDLPRDGITNEIETTACQIINAGSGWGQNTQFVFRLYQANSYAQIHDHNTADTELTKPAAHAAYSGNNRYVEFNVKTTVADANTPHGPPHSLINPSVVGITGDGYSSGDVGTVELRKRVIGATANVVGQAIAWTAGLIATLQAATNNNITGFTIYNKGNNYRSKPNVLVRHEGTGYGLKVDPVMKNGRIDSLTILDSGQSYNTNPELYTLARAADLTPVMRPTMRGKYRCAYRYADRSEQVIKTITAQRGESSTMLTVEDVTDLEAGMLLESPELADFTRIKSVVKDQLELSEEIINLPESYKIYWSTPFVNNSSGSKILGSSTATTSYSIASGTTIYSENNEFALIMQADGDLVIYQKRTFVTGFDSASGTTATEDVYDTKKWAFSDLGYVPVANAYAKLGTDGQLYILPFDWPVSNPITGTGIVIPSGQLPATLEFTNGGQLQVKSGRVIASITVRDPKKPVAYSDLSPIADIDAGPTAERSHASKMDWILEGAEPSSRCDMVELWRTSSDQSLVFYRVEAYGKPSDNNVEIVGEDTLTDEELFDPDRPNYAALPVVLPNGGVNAFRFGQPRKDMAVAVAFQDRLFMAVSTSGKDVNTLFYSEFDEFESVPDVNELPIQSNQKSNDVITALVPFGSMLLAMQHTHTYALTYNTDPSLDASIQMMSHRGTLHQRCWDIHENILYSADESGIYAMSRNGEVNDISLPVRDYFVGELIDFSKRETFFLQTDPRTHILRFFCTTKVIGTDTPAMALCYDIQAQSWWTESYPNSMTAACTGRPDAQRINTILLGGVDGNLYEYDGDGDEPNASLTGTVVTNGGSGYREAPIITVPNVEGATAQGVVSDGQLVDVIIENAGWDTDYGINILAETGVPIGGHDGKYIQGAEYAPVRLEIGAPCAGGTQAVAEADWEVMPEIKRFATMTQGANFVRVDPARVDSIEPVTHDHIATESGLYLELEQGTDQTLRTQPPLVEIGMEALGDFIPLNSYVSRIDRNDVYLQHPDGTDVSLLKGEPRTDEVLPEITVVNQTTSCNLLASVALLTQPALNVEGTTPYRIDVNSVVGITVGGVVSGSLGIPDAVTARLTAAALETASPSTAPYTITVDDATGIQIGAAISAVSNFGADLNQSIPTGTTVSSISGNVVTTNNPIYIPESAQMFASGGVAVDFSAQIILSFSKPTTVTGLETEVINFPDGTTKTVFTGGVFVDRPINIPTSSYNTVFLRFGFVGNTPVTSSLWHVGNMAQIDRGEPVSGTGIEANTTLLTSFTNTNFSDPSDLYSTSTNIVSLSKAATVTVNTAATFGYQVVPVQYDSLTKTPYLEDGGTRILVRFVKPSQTSVPFRMQTGHMPVVTEDVAKKGDQLIDRSFSLIYTPTYGDKDISLIERYNGWQEPRSNEMRRERGGPGTFVHKQDSASTDLNMNRESSSLGFATGVAKAKFASRSNADMTGTDQHIQIELFGKPSRGSKWSRTNFFVPEETVKPPLPCVLHQIVVEGVAEDG